MDKNDKCNVIHIPSIHLYIHANKTNNEKLSRRFSCDTNYFLSVAFLNRKSEVPCLVWLSYMENFKEICQLFDINLPFYNLLGKSKL